MATINIRYIRVFIARHTTNSEVSECQKIRYGGLDQYGLEHFEV